MRDNRRERDSRTRANKSSAERIHFPGGTFQEHASWRSNQKKKTGRQKNFVFAGRLSSICPKARRVRGKYGDVNGSACCARRSNEHPLRALCIRLYTYKYEHVHRHKTRRCSLTFAHTYVHEREDHTLVVVVVVTTVGFHGGSLKGQR